MTDPLVRRTDHRLLPDPRRVLAKPYVLDGVGAPPEESRASALMQRILAIPEERVVSLYAAVLASYASRHHDLETTFSCNFALVAALAGDVALSHERRMLVGAYFTHEYSVECAALFNPSIVPAPDQSGLAAGAQRFVMSLRAVGEGHISSIELCTGVIDRAGEITIDPRGTKLVGGSRAPPDHYGKALFRAKLEELGAADALVADVLDRLGARFSGAELDASLARLLDRDGPPRSMSFETAKMMRVLAASTYVTVFPSRSAISERVIFPAGPHETHGMEDARFVRFVAADGVVTYYATYTAFDGFQILPQLIETNDFVSFTISTLSGAAAQNKGMALFPRPIDGRYAMLSRKDRENLHLAFSDDVHVWNEVTELRGPVEPWELLHVGNCGSPIETEAGWIVLTHGVGPMRTYALGALLLDLRDPRRVIGCLREPLLVPDESEREGYVPNVLYTCGALAHGDDLIVPYGFSDYGVRIGVVRVSDLLAAFRPPTSA